MKYFFVQIRETYGEMEFDSSFLMAVNENEETPGDVADDIASDFRGHDDDERNSVQTMTPITEDEYKVMSKYLVTLP
jgi:hypothetical protein